MNFIPIIFQGMKLNGRPPSNISGFSDDEDAVHSGSATGFSDVDLEESSQSKSQKKSTSPFDPVNTILDKIDAELVSLTRSQSVRFTVITLNILTPYFLSILTLKFVHFTT